MPTGPWDLRITRGAVEQRFGVDQCGLLEPALLALRDRQRFARLHYQCARKALEEVLPEALPLPDVIWRTIPWNTGDRETLDDALTIVEANVIASAQSMHALLDNLAHVIYFGMGMNLDTASRIDELGIGLRRVVPKAQKLRGAERLSGLLGSIETDSTYLDALVNHGKHRSLVPLVLHVDPSNPHDMAESSYRLEFGAFTYKGKPIPARPVFDFLEQDYLRLATQVVEAGCALNECLYAGIQAPLPVTGRSD